MLIAANTIMFAMEIDRGGSEDLMTLYKLGALWPASVEKDGEWWRLGSALFLHFGWLHFTINMFSLFILGRIVEARFGTPRMLGVYSLGGLCSSAAVLYLMQHRIIETALLVGASGAVMALFGAMIAYQAVSWLRTRDILDRRPLAALLAIVIVQTVIDLSLPHVSLASHLAGLAAGLVIALPLVGLWPKRTTAKT
jgi:rhomboid protease GluP